MSPGVPILPEEGCPVSPFANIIFLMSKTYEGPIAHSLAMRRTKAKFDTFQ